MHNNLLVSILIASILCGCTGSQPSLDGELKQWHNVILTLDGPFANESDDKPNPFTDYQMDVRFTHESGSPSYLVPGYFAADGNAAESSAVSGNKWRAHLSPDKTGSWEYRISFTLNGEATEWDGIKGAFEIVKGDKAEPDLRARGRLQYVGERYLKFAGSGSYFLKAGADSPETLLAYMDFDGMLPGKGLKTWEPHVSDWKPGDPVWKDGKGKGLIGAINYLSAQGCNAFSFLTYNAGGDGDNIWPHLSHDDKLHMDCSKLDQWGIIFEHAQSKGMYLHFKLQEQENDDLKIKPAGAAVTQALDEGELGPERKLYLRELIARYGHLLALNWNLGEENSQSTGQIRDMARFIRSTDPYQHHVVLHTFPEDHDMVYLPLLGEEGILTGLSIQNKDVFTTHKEAVTWVSRSEESGHTWVVAHDEAGNAATGTPSDPDFPGTEEASKRILEDPKGAALPSIHDVRKVVLWGNLLGGGAGVEYYFGYQLPQNDLGAQDWRSRQATWDYSRIALEFFNDQNIPFWDMTNRDDLVGNPEHNNSMYCFAKVGELYLVYRPGQGSVNLDLTGNSDSYRVKWFNPRTGGDLAEGSVKRVEGGARVNLGIPPTDQDMDWLLMIEAN